MRATVVVAFASVVLLALSGCASKSDDSSSGSAASSSKTGTANGSSSVSGTSGAASGTASASGTSSSSSTGTTGPTANHAPVINVFTVNRTSGAAPLGVSFKLNATDADKDALAYKLIFADGTADSTGSLPHADVSHSFATVGNYTVKFTVSDGKTSANSTVTIAVLAATASGGVPPPVTFTGTATGVCDPTGLDGTCTTPDIIHAFTVTASVIKIVATLTWDIPVADLDLRVNDPSNTQRGKSADTNLPVADPSGMGIFGGPKEEATITEIVPDDAGQWTALIRPFTSPMVSYTLTITFS